MDAFNTALLGMLWSQLQKLELFQSQAQSLDTIHRRVGLVDGYRRWLAATATRLQQVGWLQRHESSDGACYQLSNTAPTDLAALQQAWQAGQSDWCQHPQLSASVALLNQTLTELPAILTGRRLATEVIFPNASMQLVEGFYKDNPQSDYFNHQLAEAALLYLRQVLQHNPGEKLRILEIGAGTGGTSASVFRTLQPLQEQIEVYTYSDLSRSFLLHAEREFAPQVPYLQGAIVDISRDPASQGLLAHDYHLILATNVMHAVADIHTALNHCKYLLKSDGLLLLNELTEPTLTTHCIFGLLEGWWLASDDQLRIEGSPLLSVASWQQVLQGLGFDPIYLPTAAAAKLGQQVIAGLSDGVYRAAVNADEPVPQALATKHQPQTRQLPLAAGVSVEWVCEQLVARLAETLRIPASEIGTNQAYAEYGLDSILAVGVVERINDGWQLDLSPASLFDYTSVAQLAEFLLRDYPQQLASAYNRDSGDKAADLDSSPAVAAVTTELSNLNPSPSPSPSPSSTSNKQPCSDSATQPIAVIGMAGRFPGADDIEQLWQQIANNQSQLQPITGAWSDPHNGLLPLSSPALDSSDIDAVYGGLLATRDQFDASFFQLSPWQAQQLHPHQRLVLQEGWHAIEDAGYNPRDLAQSQTCVIIGAEPIGHRSETFDGWSEAIIASRLSYFLDLRGAALVVNTGCSSSAVAMHLACDQLRLGDADLALAGGVFANLSVGFSNALCEVGMVSSQGQCRSFDQQADGTVLAEAVALVLLKRLADAERDGDAIYGVIEASAMNQDGASNGITAPNGLAQQQLIDNLYRRRGIDASHISYLESHGTGTALGDPVEVNALMRAYQGLTDNQAYCQIGSIKSQLGHTTAAAGTTGLIKILLAMRAEQRPGICQLQQVNELIQWRQSPFVIQADSSPWPYQADQRRFAALNSFGHSGTNVHLVLRDQPRPTLMDSTGPFLLPLSARSESQLRIYAKHLLSALSPIHSQAIDLAALSFTLQTGREALVARHLWLAEDIASLLQQLQAFIHSAIDESSQQIHSERLQQQRQVALWSQLDRQQQIIAEQWLLGQAVEWRSLYAAQTPNRMHLPGYPFANDDYDRQPSHAIASQTRVLPPVLHPLLQHNTSTLWQQQYQSEFDGHESFLRDHCVNGQRILPGVAYIEMLRAALLQAQFCQPEQGLLLSDVIWLRPLTVKQSESVCLQLQPLQLQPQQLTEKPEHTSNGLLVWVERGIADRSVAADDSERLFQSQVQALPLEPVTALDISDIQARLSLCSLSAEQRYRRFAELGIDYGVSHQALQQVWIGAGEMLLQLDPTLESEPLLALNPGLYDAGLQSVLCWQLQQDPGAQSPWLPFALAELRLLSSATNPTWVHLRPCVALSHSFDIDFIDADGQLLSQWRQLAVRPAATSIADPLTAEPLTTDRSSANASRTQLSLWQSHWLPASSRQATVYDGRRYLLLYGFEQTVNEASQSQWCRDLSLTELQQHPLRECEIVSEPGDLAEPGVKSAQLLQHYAAELLNWLQRHPASVEQPLQLLLLVPSEVCLSALNGMMQTAMQEYQGLQAQLLQLPKQSLNDAEFLTASFSVLQQAFANIGGLPMQLSGSATEPLSSCQQRHWQALAPANNREAAVNPWRDKGIYLITGGLGGLGRVLAQRILQRAEDAQVILLGRSVLSDPAASQRLQRLRQPLGQQAEQVHYCSIDLADLDAVEALIKQLQQQFGPLHGVFHAAGIQRDKLLLHKQLGDLQSVLAAKTTGLINLDLATAHQSLDFFVGFSSLSALLGNVGQADYATGNAFIDAYMSQRQRLVKQGQRQGLSVSLNWPLWVSDGMQVDDEVVAQFRRQWGLLPMPAAQGLLALEQALQLAASQPLSQLAISYGDSERMQRALNGLTDEHPADSGGLGQQQTSELETDDHLLPFCQQFLCQQLAEQLKIPLSDVVLAAPLERYGFDSVTVVALTRRLEQTFGRLPKTLFYEYQDLAALAPYFVRHHGETVERLLAEKSAVSPASTVPSAAIISNLSTSAKGWRLAAASSASIADKSTESSTNAAIAIIGLAGRYPGANDLEQLWHNLANGIDSVTDIPSERWQWQNYYREQPQDGRIYSHSAGFIDGVDQFDPLFFQISPKEARLMDPQERLFLQCAYHTLEDAGYTRGNLDQDGQVGVFVGVMYNEYQLYGQVDTQQGRGFAITASPASIANRVSYSMGWHGPSLAIDSMCSASLSALHLACQSLRLGECQVALAGGVNVCIHPNKFFMLAQGHFASAKGHCHSFGADGDGYVPGEGVGAALLKPLAAAEHDGDHIYGVILASQLNHGGKTNGYTVPNPLAQGQLIANTLQAASIDPASIGYVEAHGTGTPLGDPIEVAGLCRAFCRDNPQAPTTIALGSVKANIGHLESAAGIAALSKVLLQMQHGQIAPSLHSQDLNPNIDFADTPFQIPQQCQSWQPLSDSEGKTFYRAGISSFGAGGANGHLIVQSYASIGAEPASEESAGAEQLSWLILSAPSRSQLQQRLLQLQSWLSAANDESLTLTDIAYTLQVGRESMAWRLAWRCEHLQQLAEQLDLFVPLLASLAAADSDQLALSDAFLAQQHWPDPLQLACVDLLNPAAADEVGDSLDQTQIVDAWLAGAGWPAADRPANVRRLSLPLLPFANQRYWVNDPAWAKEPSPLLQSKLLQTNASDFYQQRFISHWSGDEPFFAEHQYQGQAILPAMAQLLWLQQALIESLGLSSQPSPTATQIDLHDSCDQIDDWYVQQLQWLRPITPGEVALSLDWHNEDQITFRLYSLERPELSYSEGVLCQSPLEQAVSDQPSESDLDFAQLSREWSDISLCAKQRNEHYQQRGMHYGPHFQALQQLWQNPQQDQLLAQLQWPQSIQSSISVCENGSNLDDHLLYLMDAGLQALSHWLWQQSDPMAVPVSLQTSQLCPSVSQTLLQNRGPVWVLLQRRPEQPWQFDLSYYNEHGQLWLQLQALRCQPLTDSTFDRKSFDRKSFDQKSFDQKSFEHNWFNQKLQQQPEPLTTVDSEQAPLSGQAQLLCLQPQWSDVPLSQNPSESHHGNTAELTQLWLDWPPLDADKPVEIPFDGQVLQLERPDGDRSGASRYCYYVEQLWSWLQQQLSACHQQAQLLQILLPQRSDSDLMMGLYGLLLSAQREQPRFTGQLICIDPELLAQPQALQRAIAVEADHGQSVLLRLPVEAEGIRRQVRQWLPLPAAAWHDTKHQQNQAGTNLATTILASTNLASTIQASTIQVPPLLRDAGVYWITGGLGQLGRWWLQQLSEQCRQQNVQATVILSGRSPLDDGLLPDLPSSEASLLDLHYWPLDVCDHEAVNELVQRILQQFGALHGICHSAGLIDDGFIAQKDANQLAPVLSVKVTALQHLHDASVDLPLDYFVAFSSLASLLGNAGQADYAAGNGFVDAFIDWRQRQVQQGLASGRSLVFNWPLWQADADANMNLSTTAIEQLAQQTGLQPLPHAEASLALQQVWHSDAAQVAVLFGHVERSQMLLQQRQGWPTAQAGATADSRTPSLFAESDGISSFYSTQSAPALADADQAVSMSTTINVMDGSDALQVPTQRLCKQVLAEQIELPTTEIDIQRVWEDYGVDSVMVLNMTQALEQMVAELPKTLFFEFTNVQQLSDYLIEYHSDKLRQHFQLPQHSSQPLVAADRNTEINSAEKITANALSKNAGRNKRFKYPGNKSVNRSEVVDNKNAPIAIIGIAGRYPKAANLQEFWQNLVQARDCIDEIPTERWDYRRYFDEQKGERGKSYSKWGGFIDDVAMFDPLFFHISPIDAEHMDPQERLFLQTAYHTLEDAAYTRASLNQQGPVGVFVGVMYDEYQLFGYADPQIGEGMALPSNPASVAHRLSYFGDFCGPSLTVNTMCSSSLTAIHLACNSLRQGDCQVALAGGVNLSLHPNKYWQISQGRFASSEGRCRSFGADGDGYVPGEGVGAVLLKPLAAAEADSDAIYAVLLASAINHGGTTKGYSVPSPQAQAQVIKQALSRAQMDASRISYVEAHGTGTALGDPIEIDGLTRAFANAGKPADESSPRCAIGSVKSNIGHCESAAGIAGLSKIILQMQHQQLVPSLHAETLNPYLNFDKTPFELQRQLTEWSASDGQPRVAGLSSFGAGGANAHLIIEQYVSAQVLENQIEQQPQQILLSSARAEGLLPQTQQLQQYLTDHPHTNLADLAYTLQVGREHQDFRLALQSSSLAHLQQQLQAYIDNYIDHHNGSDKRNLIADLYQGQLDLDDETLQLFSQDDEMQEAVQKWLERGKTAKLLSLWCKGLQIDWSSLQTRANRRRLHLPGYVFERSAYWVQSPRLLPAFEPFNRASSTHNSDNQSSMLGAVKSVNQTVAGWLHPLLQKQIAPVSDRPASAHRQFVSQFSGDEFFLADHQVQQQRLMPAVAYLEAVRAAMDIHHSSADQAPGQILCLENISWLRPFLCPDGGAELQLTLGKNDSFKWQGPEPQGGKNRLYCCGRARWQNMEAASVLPLAELQQQLQHSPSLRLQFQQDFYQQLENLGLHYGPGQRGLQQLFSDGQQVLARLQLPTLFAQQLTPFVMHPSLLDAGLQAAAALVISDDQNACLPYRLQQLRLLSACQTNMWVWIRWSEVSTVANPEQTSERHIDETNIDETNIDETNIDETNIDEPKNSELSLDLDFCDDQGRVCVQMRGLAVKASPLLLAPVPPSSRKKPSQTTLVADTERQKQASETLLLTPHWQPLHWPASDHQAANKHVCRIVVIARSLGLQSSVKNAAEFEQQLLQRDGPYPVDEVYWLDDTELSTCEDADEHSLSTADVYHRLASQLFERLQNLLQSRHAPASDTPPEQDIRPFADTLLQVCVPDDGASQLLAGLAPLLKTAQQEQPHLFTQLLQMDAASVPVAVKSWQTMLTQLSEPLWQQSGKSSWQHVALRNQQLYRRHWQNLPPLADTEFKKQTVWRDQGVYLISGGLGGLGLIFAREIARRCQSATLILTGRSPLSTVADDGAKTVADSKQQQLDQLADLGVRVDYQAVDVTDAAAVAQLMHCIHQQYGQLHGILHSAGVIHDSLISQKSQADWHSVLAVKVAGLVNLDHHSCHFDLDWLIGFSSVTGALGNIGQADYAAANGFVDRFLNLRQQWTEQGLRHGRSLAINWPLWQEGGMQVTQIIEQMMRRNSGTEPMQTRAGLNAFYTALAQPASQVMVLQGQASLMRQKLLHEEIEAVANKNYQTANHNGDIAAISEEQFTEQVREMAASLIKMAPEKLKIHQELGKYGFDSVNLTDFSQRLLQSFDIDVSVPVFYEYPTLQQLSQHLWQQYGEHIRATLATQPNLESAAEHHQWANNSATINTLRGNTESIEVNQALATTGEPAVIVSPLIQAPQSVTTGHKPVMSQTEIATETNPSMQQASLSPAKAQNLGDIAIVGLSGRFPKADNIEQFWDNVMQGRNCIETVPANRWDWQQYYGPAQNGEAQTEVKWGGFIDSDGLFDGDFFGLDTAEQAQLNPAQQLMISYIWKALEDAALVPSQLAESATGVFIAAAPVSSSDGLDMPSSSLATSFLPNRLSFMLNLCGPSEYYETACSSALVAVHHALRSLKLGECDLALVGAVNVILSVKDVIGFDAMGHLSHSGQTKSFQADADGFIQSEGVAALVLKPLATAEQDGDPIYATIKGSGVAHGGAGMSFAAPNARGIKNAMKQAYRSANIEPDTVTYIEAHGIATDVGDGIEIDAIKSAYQSLQQDWSQQQNSERGEPRDCYIGSLKPCIGHGVVVSGMAAIIKTVMALKHQVRPGIAGFDQLNPYIKLDNSRFHLQRDNHKWRMAGRDEQLPRRASINSFGLGGVNAHLVLQEYIEQRPQSDSNQAWQLLPLSAKTPQQLVKLLQQLLNYLKLNRDIHLEDLAYTLQQGREWMDLRVVYVVASTAELIDLLQQQLDELKQTPFNTETSQRLWQACECSSEANEQANHWLDKSFDQQPMDRNLRARRISLPSYPFNGEIREPDTGQPRDRLSENRDSVTFSPETVQQNIAALSDAAKSATAMAPLAKKQQTSSKKQTANSTAITPIAGILSELLETDPEQLDLQQGFAQLGVSSASYMVIWQEVQKYAPEIDLDSLVSCKRVLDLQPMAPELFIANKPGANKQIENNSNIKKSDAQPLGHSEQKQTAEKNPALQNNTGSAVGALAVMPINTSSDNNQALPFIPHAWPNFPELICLNTQTEGTPIFWIHPEHASVACYKTLAEQSQQPCYGIQPKGWLTEDSPLGGVQEMALYYLHIIKNVQPEGPYQLGAYRGGAAIAYEITRQLQELGDQVQALTLIQPREFGQLPKVSKKSLVLQAANRLILRNVPEHLISLDVLHKVAVHQREIAGSLTDREVFRILLAELVERTGLAENLVEPMFDKTVRVFSVCRNGALPLMPLLEQVPEVLVLDQLVGGMACENFDSGYFYGGGDVFGDVDGEQGEVWGALVGKP